MQNIPKDTTHFNSSLHFPFLRQDNDGVYFWGGSYWVKYNSEALGRKCISGAKPITYSKRQISNGIGRVGKCPVSGRNLYLRLDVDKSQVKWLSDDGATWHNFQDVPLGWHLWEQAALVQKPGPKRKEPTSEDLQKAHSNMIRKFEKRQKELVQREARLKDMRRKLQEQYSAKIGRWKERCIQLEKSKSPADFHTLLGQTVTVLLYKGKV